MQYLEITRMQFVSKHSLLQNTIPIVTSRNSKQREKRHSEILEVGMLSQSVTGVIFGAF